MGQVLNLDRFRGARPSTDCRIWLWGVLPLWRRHRWGRWILDKREYHNPVMAADLDIPLRATRSISYVRIRDCERCGFTEMEEV